MTAPLREGSRGPDVRALQWMLLATGHDPGPLDGAFGPRTRAAVEASANSKLPIVTAADIEQIRALPRRPVEVPRALTPASLVDVRAALAVAYADTFPGGEDEDALTATRVALAHLAEEHGLHMWTPTLAREHAIPWWLSPTMDALAFVAIWGCNLGNRQLRREDRGFAMSGWESPMVPWFCLRSAEVIDGRRKMLSAPYYAYPDLAEAARGYWAVLRDHYPAALAAMEAGDVPGAARALKGLGEIGGPFAVGDMVALIVDADENRRGRVEAGAAAACVRVRWPSGTVVDIYEGELRHAAPPYYTGSLSAYAAGMVTSWGRVG